MFGWNSGVYRTRGHNLHTLAHTLKLTLLQTPTHNLMSKVRSKVSLPDFVIHPLMSKLFESLKSFKEIVDIVSAFIDINVFLSGKV